MILGIAITVLNLVLNVVLIRGLGPIPAYGTKGAAMGTVHRVRARRRVRALETLAGGWVVSFPSDRGYAPDWEIIRSLFRFGLPTGIQGIAMNVGGVFMLAFIGSLAQSAAAQAAFAIVVHAAVLAHHVDVGGADGRGGRGGGTEPRGRQSRSRGRGGARRGALRARRRRDHRQPLLPSRGSCSRSSA